MNVLVFGSTGPTGRQLVDQALARGHRVTAFARTPAKLDLQHDQLTIAQGDATDPDAVARTLAEQDAVLCAIGAPGLDKSRIRARATRVIVDAMRDAAVKRLVCLSALGVADSRAALPLSLKIIIPLLLRHAFADHEEQERILKDSALDWTVVRPPYLTNGPRTANYQHGFTTRPAGAKLRISRADVADFMLNQLEDDTYLRRAAAVTT
ncbi:MAG: SDR family oxidoreductase [Planctomycetota bacterium]